VRREKVWSKGREEGEAEAAVFKKQRVGKR
jgi:hypothetical protein